MTTKPSGSVTAKRARELAMLKAFRADIQGRKGEEDVRHLLKETGLESLHDYVLPTRSGKATQADHAALCGSGILVIETKRFSGVIQGHPHNDWWYQVLPSGHVSRFYNPVRQNTGHCEAVYEIVRTLHPDIRVINRVVFTGRPEIDPALANVVMTLPDLREELKTLSVLPVSAPLQAGWTRLKEACVFYEGLRKEITSSPFF